MVESREMNPVTTITPCLETAARRPAASNGVGPAPPQVNPARASVETAPSIPVNPAMTAMPSVAMAARGHASSSGDGFAQPWAGLATRLLAAMAASRARKHATMAIPPVVMAALRPAASSRVGLARLRTVPARRSMTSSRSPPQDKTLRWPGLLESSDKTWEAPYDDGNSGGNSRFDAYRIVNNTGTAQTITVEAEINFNASVQDRGGALFIYDAYFNPAFPKSGYLSGTAASLYPTGVLAIDAGQTRVLVISGAAEQSYNIQIYTR